MNPGPYYIAYLQNNQLEEQVVVHTFAEHFAFVYGVLKPSEQWVMTKLIGPFGLQSDAEAYAESLNPPPPSLKVWTFNELITIPEYTVLTLGNIKKLK